MNESDRPTDGDDDQLVKAVATIKKAIEVVRRIASNPPEAGAASTSDWLEEVEEAMKAVRLEMREVNRHRALLGSATSVTITAVIARSVKQMRQQCGRTQAQLADDMSRLGFDWKRITVAETESGKRRPSWEELVGLCALFGTPLPKVLGGLNMPEVIELNERHLVNAANYVLLIGMDPDDLFTPNVDIERLEVAAVAGAAIAQVDAPFSDEDWRPIAEYRRRVLQSEDEDS